MKMAELKFNIPQDILYTLNETQNDFIKKMKLYAAMELYRMQKLSMGKASELAEMNKIDFMFELGKYEIPAINYDADDFIEEVHPIVDEVREARIKHAAKFNFDLKKIAQDLNEKQSKRKTVSYPPKKPLQGKPFKYVDPFGSVAEDDWEVLK